MVPALVLRVCKQVGDCPTRETASVDCSALLRPPLPLSKTMLDRLKFGYLPFRPLAENGRYRGSRSIRFDLFTPIHPDIGNEQGDAPVGSQKHPPVSISERPSRRPMTQYDFKRFGLGALLLSLSVGPKESTRVVYYRQYYFHQVVWFRWVHQPSPSRFSTESPCERIDCSQGYKRL